MPQFPIQELNRLNQLYYSFSLTQSPWQLLPDEYYKQPWLELDLSSNNKDLQSLELDQSMHPLGAYINNLLDSRQLKVGYGGWQEDRHLYKTSRHFAVGSESRSIHLGVDLWFPAGSRIICPFPAKLHSFQDNANFLDYGPTLILEHKLSTELKFFTLFGHLTRESLDGKRVGQVFEAGEPVAWLGAPPVNGDWPPHLHFQIILDMLSKMGDFPGVSSTQDKDFYRQLCPDPGALLKPVTDSFLISKL